MPTFTTPDPIDLRIRNGSGRVEVSTDAHLTTTIIDITGLDEAGVRAAETVTITHHGDAIAIEVPERTFRLGRSPQILVAARMPAHSTAEVTVGSADVTIGDGCRAIRVTTGSGDLRIGHVDDDADIRSGSGDVSIGHVGATLPRQHRLGRRRPRTRRRRHRGHHRVRGRAHRSRRCLDHHEDRVR